MLTPPGYHQGDRILAANHLHHFHLQSHPWLPAHLPCFPVLLMPTTFHLFSRSLGWRERWGPLVRRPGDHLSSLRHLPLQVSPGKRQRGQQFGQVSGIFPTFLEVNEVYPISLQFEIDSDQYLSGIVCWIFFFSGPNSPSVFAYCK